MKPIAGMALDNRYRLERQIAVGGMGEVWVAHDQSLAREVAVKVLREEFAGDSGFLERFRTEARNSASLSHPNIAQLYDYGEQDGSAYLVMELVAGEPMSDLLEREPVLPTTRLLPILAQTARALHAAHVAGVVHRDIKPGNILLGRAGRVKITDFGVSMAVNQVPMTATGMVMGTAQYLSPEQAVGRPATPASDLYSLGIVAYESLVGHRPFTGPTAVDIAVAHVNQPVPPLPTSVEPRLATLVMQMLSKQPADRPRSATALARMFDAMVAGTPPEGIRVVTGAPVDPRAEPQPTDAEPEPAPPPSYPPRRELRTSGEVPAAPGASRRTSTTTGRRLGWLTWPLIALLLLLVAVLGAVLADSLMGSDSGASPAAATIARLRPSGGAPEPATIGGMISQRAPAGPTAGALTTRGKDA
ncbi:MAG TPA: serine/threonine-protein kinase [Pengzhenrongella sp.]